MTLPARGVDSRAQKPELAAGMRQLASRRKKKLDYPDETEGSRIAAKARRMASKLTSEERRAHFNAAMVMIYGGTGAKKAALTRH